MLSTICQILTLATCKDQIFNVELQESGRLWQLFVEFYFIHNIEVPTMDALQFIEFETQFEPVDKKITNINIMNERKNSSSRIEEQVDKEIVLPWQPTLQFYGIKVAINVLHLYLAQQSNDVSDSLAKCLSIQKEVMSMKHSSS